MEVVRPNYIKRYALRPTTMVSDLYLERLVILSPEISRTSIINHGVSVFAQLHYYLFVRSFPPKNNYFPIYHFYKFCILEGNVE